MNPKHNEKRWERLRPSSTIHYSLLTINSPKGFTLVELLTVIVIISMLAAISLVALNGAYKEAKIAKTRGTIAKLDAAIQQIFEEFGDRYEEKAIDQLVDSNFSTAQINTLVDDFASATFSSYYSVDPVSAQEKARAAIKRHLIGDMMRMEMPQSWAEVFDSQSPPNSLQPIPIPITISGIPVRVPQPAVFSYYYTEYCRYSGDPAIGPSQAALLYLIIANLNPEALESFHSSEIGDPDDEGFPKFLDAWGRPIQFLRWAPGFVGSDRQPDVVTNAGIVDLSDWQAGPNDLNLDYANPSPLETAFIRAGQKMPDPFDSTDHLRGWFLYPLVYSAGPDGVYNIQDGIRDSNDPLSPNDPRMDDGPGDTSRGYQLIWLDPFQYPAGLPGGSTNSGGHFDNIHNHRSAGGF